MEYHAARNMVILALAQCGVIVAAVLAAGAAYKWFVILDYVNSDIPLMCDLMVEYGWLSLLLPLIWVYFAFKVFSNPRASDRMRSLIVFIGLLIVALGILAAWYGAAKPWLGLVLRGCSF